jgi:dihydrolipoamide dehydrogenase
MTELLVLGGGPGGVAAAQTAARMGARVTLVERAGLGGTCVHAGCIPSGAFHRTASMLDELGRAERVGVRAALEGVDWARLQAWVGSVVSKAAGLTRAALDSAGVEVVAAPARFTGPGRVEVDGRVFEGMPVVLATGAASFVPELPHVPSCPVLTNTEAMALDRPPGRLLVSGSGRFSLEWADLFAHLGSRVTVATADARVLPGEDSDIAGFLQLVLEQRGLRFQFGVAPDVALPEADAVLFADTRAPITAGLGLEIAGIEVARNGRGVIVDAECRTTAPGAFAVGDVTGPPWLSNRARAMGATAASRALGGTVRFRPERLPRSVNTHPELAAVGMTEEEAAARGMDAAVGFGELSTSLRGITLGEDQGALKLVVDTEFGEILGGHMVGVGATEVIAQVAAAMELEADYRDLARVQHLHPSLAELVTDAIASI